jgi:hypothetical protein
VSDYLVPLRKRLLDPEIIRWLGDGVWLLIWAIDRVTDEATVQGEVRGRVYGGATVQARDIRSQLGLSSGQFARMVKPFLAPGNPVCRFHRVSHGYIVEVVNLPKFSQYGISQNHEMANSQNHDMAKSQNHEFAISQNGAAPMDTERTREGEHNALPNDPERERTTAVDEEAAATWRAIVTLAPLSASRRTWMLDLLPRREETHLVIREASPFRRQALEAARPQLERLWEQQTGHRPTIRVLEPP